MSGEKKKKLWICFLFRSRQMSGPMKGETWWWRFEMKGWGNRCLAWDPERQASRTVKYRDSAHTEYRQRKASGFSLPQNRSYTWSSFKVGAEDMLKFGASFCLNKSLFKASKSKRNLFEYAEICTLFCQCVDTKESSKQNNTEKEN